MEYEQIKPMLDELKVQGVEFSLDMTHKGLGRLWIRNVKQTSDNYHAVIGILTRFYGRLDKEFNGGSQSWNAEKDGQCLYMYSVAQCKVVGYRTVERKKTVEVETEDIETSEEPIYDCTSAE